MAKKISFFLTAYLPIIFSLSVCSGFGTIAGLVLSCLSIILMPEIHPKKLMPIIVSFLIIGLPGNSLLTTLTFGILLILYSVFFNKIRKYIPDTLNSGIMLAGALTATVHFTTYYFGIGATGENVSEMIKSYVSLGFHPNWRGVLYGTIVLVLMITFPRKFKEISKYLSAPFIALFFTLILNLFLNPSDMTTAITEISPLSTEHFFDFISSGFHFKFNILSVINGIALFLLCAGSFSDYNESEKKDFIIYSGANLLSVGIFSLTLPYGLSKNKSTLAPRIISIIILCVSFLIFRDYAERIPMHSCAVVIIVSAWENVKWAEIKKSFSKIPTTLSFMISFIISMITDIPTGIIITFIFAALFNKISNNRRPAD